MPRETETTRPPEETEKSKEVGKSGNRSLTAGDATRGGAEVNTQNLFPTGDTNRQQQQQRPGDTSGSQATQPWSRATTEASTIPQYREHVGAEPHSAHRNSTRQTNPDGGTKETTTITSNETYQRPAAGGGTETIRSGAQLEQNVHYRNKQGQAEERQTPVRSGGQEIQIRASDTHTYRDNAGNQITQFAPPRQHEGRTINEVYYNPTTRQWMGRNNEEQSGVTPGAEGNPQGTTREQFRAIPDPSKLPGNR
ncbi:MAG: hypothetical protein HY711_06875 [Candidatus Melainabacteria bacterium]|nr:hypothetical protein [Candidatus Melainabacteria bacterium]